MLIQKNDHVINYDDENDILYLSFGNPVPSYGEEKYEGIIFRFDMETDELSGITILNFRKKLKRKEFMNISLPINFEKIQISTRKGVNDWHIQLK